MSQRARAGGGASSSCYGEERHQPGCQRCWSGWERSPGRLGPHGDGRGLVVVPRVATSPLRPWALSAAEPVAAMQRAARRRQRPRASAAKGLGGVSARWAGRPAAARALDHRPQPSWPPTASSDDKPRPPPREGAGCRQRRGGAGGKSSFETALVLRLNRPVMPSWLGCPLRPGPPSSRHLPPESRPPAPAKSPTRTSPSWPLSPAHEAFLFGSR